TQVDGSGLPRSLIEPMTIEAESADVTKNTMIEIIASTEVTMPNGNCSSNAKSIASGEPAALISLPVSSNHIAVPPKIENHRAHTAAGTRITTVTNSRNVRPREILAMNRPTNGVQETHHAQ